MNQIWVGLRAEYFWVSLYLQIVFVLAGKGEAVCLDRCVAKYLDIHERIGKKLTAMSMQDEALLKNMSG